MDRTCNPDNYGWLVKEEKAEDDKRRASGKMPKRRKLNRAVAAFLYDKFEIERIMVTTFKQLNRKEMSVHKLMSKVRRRARRAAGPALAAARTARAASAAASPALAAARAVSPRRRAGCLVVGLRAGRHAIGAATQSALSWDRHRRRASRDRRAVHAARRDDGDAMSLSAVRVRMTRAPPPPPSSSFSSPPVPRQPEAAQGARRVGRVGLRPAPRRQRAAQAPELAHEGGDGVGLSRPGAQPGGLEGAQAARRDHDGHADGGPSSSLCSPSSPLSSSSLSSLSSLSSVAQDAIDRPSSLSWLSSRSSFASDRILREEFGR